MNPLGLAALGGALWWLSRLNRNPDGAGFRDKNGRFHPIRSSEWYQPSLLDQPETARPASRVKRPAAPTRPAAEPVRTPLGVERILESRLAIVAKVKQAREELRELEIQQGAEATETAKVERDWEAARELVRTLRKKQEKLADDFEKGLGWQVTDPLREVSDPRAQVIWDELTTQSYRQYPTRTPDSDSRGSNAMAYFALLQALPRKLEPILSDAKQASGIKDVQNANRIGITLENAAKKMKELKAWDNANAKLVAAVAVRDSYPDQLRRFMSYGEGWQKLEAARAEVRNAEAAAEAAGIRFLADQVVMPGDTAGMADVTAAKAREAQQWRDWETQKQREASIKLQKELKNEADHSAALARAMFDVEDAEAMLTTPGATAKQYRGFEVAVSVAKQKLARLQAQNPATYVRGY